MISDYALTLSDGVNKVEFDVIAEVSDNDYEWSSSAVLKRKSDGALFYVEDSGCSCYGFGDNLTVADLRPIFSFAAARQLVDDAEEWARLRTSRELREVVYR